MPLVDMHRLQELVRLHRFATGPRETARLLDMSPKTELLDGDPNNLPELEVLKAAVREQIPDTLPHAAPLPRDRDRRRPLPQPAAGIPAEQEGRLSSRFLCRTGVAISEVAEVGDAVAGIAAFLRRTNAFPRPEPRYPLPSGPRHFLDPWPGEGVACSAHTEAPCLTNGSQRAMLPTTASSREQPVLCIPPCFATTPDR